MRLNNQKFLISKIISSDLKGQKPLHLILVFTLKFLDSGSTGLIKIEDSDQTGPSEKSNQDLHSLSVH